MTPRDVKTITDIFDEELANKKKCLFYNLIIKSGTGKYERYTK